MINGWTLYREFGFENNRSELTGSEMTKVSEIAQYSKENPSLKIGIDGAMNTRNGDPQNEEMSDRRVNSIRNALIKAGVPRARIQTGVFGDGRLARDRRVAVLIRTEG
jgi:outer membrane protein OmpA-like peptidoglycan-associated protein